MAAITSTLVSLAGVGLSVGKAIQGQQQAKAANAAAEAAAATMAGQQATNEMAALQTPDVSSLAFQEAQGQTQMQVQALQEMGVEGAANVGRVAEAGRRSTLEAAQAQGIAQQATQEKRLKGEQAKEDTNLAMRRQEATMELEGARAAEAAGKEQMAEGIGQAVTGLGATAAEFNKYGVAKGFISEKFDVSGGDGTTTTAASGVGSEKVIGGVTYVLMSDGTYKPKG